MVVLLELLETIRAASDALQEEGIALDSAFKLIDDAEKTIAEHRSDEHFQKLITEAKEIARQADLDCNFAEKRVRRKKRLPGEDARDEPQDAITNFKTNVFLSSIDTCLTQLKERFGQNREILTSFNILTPTELLKTDPIGDELKTLTDTYGQEISGVLPDIDSLQTPIEFENWKRHVINHKEDIFPNGYEKGNTKDLFQYLYITHLCHTFPNVYKLYQIFLTIPATTASAERSFSKLKIIKTYRRSTMAENRLSGLSILSIERQFVEKIDFEETIDIFANLGCRRFLL
ncbi:zinc finger MYM-type protein 1-like [Amphiura filiformis]|uniref:zinc finger MYM-type protein 1-like n=1 Tax=Amphiura filiformis TaxID=82378 RepID=UPI003B20FE4E